jgi:glycerate 2-kinase
VVTLVDIARTSFSVAVEASDVGRALSRSVTLVDGTLHVPGASVDLSRYRELRVAAVGKAAHPMLASFARALDDGPPLERIGLAIAHTDIGPPPPEWCRRLAGSHPVPDERSFAAGRELLAMFGDCGPESLAVFLLSGGGSALCEWPLDERVRFEDFASLNEILVRSSLPIRAINAVRKHVSAIKGGRLAMRAAPADQLTLVASDVQVGDVQSVASGPTLPDDTTVDDVARALDESRIRERLPESLRRALAPRTLAETPKEGDFAGLRRWAATLVDSSTAARAASAEIARHAISVKDGVPADGDLEMVVDAHLRSLERAMREAGPHNPCAVVSAGEVTLDVAGDGLGGRNQQSVLYALSRVGALCPSAGDFALLSAGTDGRDGPTDAAGAAAGPDVLRAALDGGLDLDAFLRRNDAYRFFEEVGGLIVTGPTGTNVRDVRIFLGRSREAT